MVTREQKEKVIKELTDNIVRQKALIFINFTGINVKDLTNLRKKLKANLGELKVAKKTLMDIVFKKAKFGLEIKELQGEIALVFGFKDEISPSKTLWQFSLENPNLQILGGFLDNKFVDAAKIIELAQLPTQEELLARLVGSIKAPVSNFVYALQYNIKGLIYALSEIKK